MIGLQNTMHGWTPLSIKISSWGIYELKRVFSTVVPSKQLRHVRFLFYESTSRRCLYLWRMIYIHNLYDHVNIFVLYQNAQICQTISSVFPLLTGQIILRPLDHRDPILIPIKKTCKSIGLDREHSVYKHCTFTWIMSHRQNRNYPWSFWRSHATRSVSLIFFNCYFERVLIIVFFYSRILKNVFPGHIKIYKQQKVVV